jgi:hypothetical protein
MSFFGLVPRAFGLDAFIAIMGYAGVAFELRDWGRTIQNVVRQREVASFVVI